jgi:hypothetical protein
VAIKVLVQSDLAAAQYCGAGEFSGETESHNDEILRLRAQNDT